MARPAQRAVAAAEQFESVLFEPGARARTALATDEPDYFADLNLDQVWAALAAGREDHDLAPFFRTRLRSPAAVSYRHEVVRDLEHEEVSVVVYTFAAEMRELRRQLELAGRLRDRHQSERWFVSAVRVYCDAVAALARGLASVRLGSRGLVALLGYLRSYTSSDAFEELEAETAELERELGEVTYSLLLDNLRVTVRPGRGEPSLTDRVERTFAKFRQGDVKDHTVHFHARVENNPVEERVLALVAELNPELFGRIAGYVARRREFQDTVVRRFDREVQFLLAYLEYIGPLRSLGLPFCYPVVSATSKRTRAIGSFDLALAKKLSQAEREVVCNDLELRDHERIIVVTGPNQGGKTTFARMFGQLHHCAALGLPVPGASAELFLPDQLLTHFEREEDPQTLRGKFEDELLRLHTILGQATGDSVLVMNESFNSTTLRDALWVGERILRRLVDRDLLCVCVTFIDELASAGESIVSMMSTVDPDDATRRTFRVVRKPADGLAYAIALAEQHRVSYAQLKERLQR